MAEQSPWCLRLTSYNRRGHPAVGALAWSPGWEWPREDLAGADELSERFSCSVTEQLNNQLFFDGTQN